MDPPGTLLYRNVYIWHIHKRVPARQGGKSPDNYSSQISSQPESTQPEPGGMQDSSYFRYSNPYHLPFPSLHLASPPDSSLQSMHTINSTPLQLSVYESHKPSCTTCLLYVLLRQTQSLETFSRAGMEERSI